MAKPTVQMELPPGMTKEQFDKLFNTFVKNNISGKAKGKAQSLAIKDLRTKYKDEYDASVAKYMPKA